MTMLHTRALSIVLFLVSFVAIVFYSSHEKSLTICTTHVEHVHRDREPSTSSIHTIDEHDTVNHPQNRISFRLHSPDVISPPFQFLSVPGYTCPPSIAPLPPAVDHPTILNFTTTIETDLKVLFVGDSIMQQFAQSFYSSVLIHASANTSFGSKQYVWGGKDGRHVILRAFINGAIPELSGLHVCSSLSGPVQGGGIVGYYRLLDLPNREGRRQYVYCKNEKGWSWGDVREFLDFTVEEDGEVVPAKPLVRANSTHDSPQTTWYKSQLTSEGNTTNRSKTQTVGSFNAIVIRPPGPGWMKLHEITRERIIESIQLLHELFAVETVILTTLAFNNNVVTSRDWKDMLAVNQMIREVAAHWDNVVSGVKFVLVQDFAAFTNEILWMNGRHLGYNVCSSLTMQPRTYDTIPAEWANEGPMFLLHRIAMREWKFNPSIPMVCNTPPVCVSFATTLPNGTTVKDINELCVMNITADKSQCFFNRFSRDGMHWCVETVGPRFSGSVACLLGCVYNGATYEKYESASYTDKTKIMEGVKECEEECNGRFMSLVPVDEGWLKNNIAVYSKCNHCDV
ncbi:hypothetical protein HJC23_006155 [Cyclotella cryptica]|uniref:Uncharacterized protein n=1 Tax=Cyclotella cryptica TaxID=29204 RepID=A0ABD3PD13_9STRA|eukprot:CCRYP_016136-RA/>CCRYP_016136-RA protein AED:0.00 eAED:0.00 QI:288/-1/1/1/-1/1/1/736/567